jgi:sodium/hydrogen antiporter
MDELSRQLNLTLAALGLLIVSFGLISRVLKERLSITDPMLALWAGVALGPVGLNLLRPGDFGLGVGALEAIVGVLLAIQIFAVTLRLPPGYPLRRWRSLSAMLGLVMPLMWAATAAVLLLVLGLPFWIAVLVAAVLTPTDPVLATTLVMGKLARRNLPLRLRNLLLGESAANDGLAWVLVMAPIYALTRWGEGPGLQWLLWAVGWEVLGAVVMGAAVGAVAGSSLMWAERHETIDRQSFLAFTLGLSVATLSVVNLLGADGVFAVFACGISFSMRVGGQERSEEEGVQEAVDHVISPSVFLLLGVLLPWGEWMRLGWPGLAAAVGVLVLRRLPAVLALQRWVPDLRAPRDAGFVGWFGPIGAGALYYASVAGRHTGERSVWVVVSLVVACSVLAHGLSSAPLLRAYGRRGSGEDDPVEESG